MKFGAPLLLLVLCLPVAGCSRQSQHRVERVETIGATVEDNALLGLTPQQVNDFLRQKLAAEGHFTLVHERPSGVAPNLGLQLQLAFTREARKGGREGTFAEVGATMTIRRKESDGFASYEVVGVGEVKIPGDGMDGRREAMRRALGIALVGEESMASLDFRQARRLPEALEPRLGKLFGLVELFGVEIVETMVIVIVLGAGDELP